MNFAKGFAIVSGAFGEDHEGVSGDELIERVLNSGFIGGASSYGECSDATEELAEESFEKSVFSHEPKSAGAGAANDHGVEVAEVNGGQNDGSGFRNIFCS